MLRGLLKTKPNVVLLVFLVLFTGVWFGPRPTSGALNDPLPTKVAVNPSSIASLSVQPGSTITFELNATNAQPFGGFTVAIFFNNSVLQFSGLDYSGGVFGNDLFLVSECVDAFTVPNGVGPCFPDFQFDGVGVVSLTLITNSGLNTNTPNGKLFSVTFRVLSVGFSTLHFVHQELLTDPDGTPLQSVSYDGFFTNKICGAGNLCKPPIVSFTPPVEPGVNQPETVQGTAASQNSDGRITEYNWTWGSGLSKQYYNSPPPGTTTPSPKATLIFRNYDFNEVTLSAQDNYGARTYYSVEVFVLNSRVDMTGFFTDPNLKALFRVNVTLENGTVRSTDPRDVLAWINVTNSGAVPLQSLRLTEMLPPDWTISPHQGQEKGAVHAYYANTPSLATYPEITDPSSITVISGNPQTLIFAMPSLNATAMGHPLLQGQSIVVSVKLSYALLKTSQSSTNFLKAFFDYATVVGWSQPSYTGTEALERPFSQFFMYFIGYVNVVGDHLISHGDLTVIAMASQKDWMM